MSGIKDNFSFGPDRRLHHSTEFDRVFKHNRYRRGNDTFLLLAVDNELGYSRLGMVIGKRTVARAAQRNIIKRRIREAFRHADLPAVDIVVLGRAGCARRTATELADQIRKDLAHLAGKLSP